MAVFAQLRRLIHHKRFSNITAKLATFSGKSKKRRTEKKKSSKRKRNLQIQTVFVYKYGKHLVHEKMTRLLVHPLVVAAKNACERLDESAYVTRALSTFTERFYALALVLPIQKMAIHGININFIH